MEIMKLHDPRQDPQKALVRMQAAYRKMHEPRLNTRGPIVYSLCQYSVDSVWEWDPQVGGTCGAQPTILAIAIAAWR